MEQFTIKLRDAAYLLTVPAHIASKMRNDKKFALQTLKEAVENSGVTAERNTDKEAASLNNSPQCKKICQVATPESVKPSQVHCSTPKSCAKSLNFSENVALSSRLRVGNLPVPFMERMFVNFLEKLILKYNINKDVEATVIKCCYTKVSNSAVIEFNTPQTAEKLQNIKDIRFLNQTLSLEVMPHEVDDNECNQSIGSCYLPNESNQSNGNSTPPKLYSDQTFDGVSAFQDNNNNSCAENKGFESGSAEQPALQGNFIKPLTTKAGNGVLCCEKILISATQPNPTIHTRENLRILVSNLPEGYDKDYLLFLINKCLWDKNKSDHGTEYVIEFKENGPSSATLQFVNDELAEQICACKQFAFQGVHLNFKICNGDLNIEKHKLIEITNLPHGYAKDYLKFVINKNLWTHGKADKGAECITDFRKNGETSAILQFEDDFHGKHICALENFTFQGASLTFNPYCQSRTKDDDPVIFKEVEVTKLPVGYDEDHLKFDINWRLWTDGLVDQGTECIVELQKKGPDCAIVQFIESKYAMHMCACKQFVFQGFNLNFKICNGGLNIKKYKLIKITNLPHGYAEDYLQFLINKYLWTDGKADEGAECITNFTKNGENSAILQFKDDKHGKHICALKNFTFQGASLTFNPYCQSTIKDNNTDIYIFKEVEVTKLPVGYDENYLKFFINCRLWGDKKAVQGSECVSDLRKNGPTCAILQFVKDEYGKHICASNELVFQGVCLKLKPHYQTQKTPNIKYDQPWENPNIHCDKQIEVAKLPQGYAEDYLKFVLNKSLWEDGKAAQGAECVRDFVRCGQTSVIIEFYSADVASYFIRKGQLIFNDKEITFLKPNACLLKKKNSESANCSGSTSHLDKCIDVEDVVPEHNAGPSTSSTDVQQGKIDLKSMEGDIIFLKELVLFRRLFMGRNHNAAYARILYELEQKGITTDVPSLMKRRKHFQDTYNKQKRLNITEYRHYEPLSVVFGGASTDVLEGTEYAFEEENGLDLQDPRTVAGNAAMFCKGAVFTISASWALIATVRDNHKLYLRAKNQDHFWKEVSSILEFKGHFYTPSRCENRFKEAQKLYKDEAQRLERTGESGPAHGKCKETWFWNDSMHAMMSKDVAVAAPVTLACGSSSQRVLKEKVSENLRVPQREPHEGLKIKNSSLTLLRRPKNKAELIGQGLSAIANAMNRRTNLEHKTAAQTNHSNYDCSDDDSF